MFRRVIYENVLFAKVCFTVLCKIWLFLHILFFEEPQNITFRRVLSLNLEIKKLFESRSFIKVELK